MTVGTTQPVRKQVTVRRAQPDAFAFFTERMGQWWNPAYSIGGEPFTTVVVEPMERGRWYERDQQGRECDWGRVLAWEPPRRLVLAWQIDAEWRFDPSLTTELEVRFLAEGPSTTRVELEHRGLDTFGAKAAAVRDIFDSPGGWAGLLERFAA